MIKHSCFEVFKHYLGDIPSIELKEININGFNFMQLVVMHSSDTRILDLLKGKGFDETIMHAKHGNLLELAVLHNNSVEMIEHLIKCYKLEPSGNESWESLYKKAQNARDDNVEVVDYLLNIILSFY